MKLNFEQYLYPIDQSFSKKKSSEVYMIYGLLAAVLLAFSYFLFWDDAEAQFNATHQARVAIEKKLVADESYLNKHPESEIAMLEKQIKNIHHQTTATKEKNEYINYKISQIPELFYNEKAWGKYIDSISADAKKFKITLSRFSNKKANDKEKFGHVLDINVQASGTYANLIKFINAMEQSDLVIDLHGLDLAAKQVLTVDINSSVWGITY